MANVAHMKKPAPIDPMLVALRTLWSARALRAVLVMLREDLTAAQGKWTKLLTESTQAMNEPLRLDLDEEKLTGKRAKELLLEARKFRRQGDERKDDKDDELSERKKTIKSFEEALNECLAIEVDANSEQLNLLDGQAGVPGMGWASKSTVESIYGAIKLLDERKVRLGDVLAELLVDLGTAGIEPVALNLSAGEAIENETPVPEANDETPAEGEAANQPAASAPVPF